MLNLSERLNQCLQLVSPYFIINWDLIMKKCTSTEEWRTHSNYSPPLLTFVVFSCGPISNLKLAKLVKAKQRKEMSILETIKNKYQWELYAFGARLSYEVANLDSLI